MPAQMKMAENLARLVTCKRAVKSHQRSTRESRVCCFEYVEDCALVAFGKFIEGTFIIRFPAPKSFG